MDRPVQYPLISLMTESVHKARTLTMSSTQFGSHEAHTSAGSDKQQDELRNLWYEESQGRP